MADVRPGSTRELIEAVKKFSEDSGRQSRRLLWLTVTIACLTAVMVVAVGVQIMIMAHVVSE